MAICKKTETNNSFPKPEDILWKTCLVNNECLCISERLESVKEKKKLNRTGLSEGKAIPYPNPIDENFTNNNKNFLKTFQVQYEGTLSILTKSILNSFQKKYIYYAIDDIKYMLNSKSIEQKNILTLLYSSMLSLHNDFSVNFFDIWIDSIYVNDKDENNRFLVNDSQNRKQITYITLKLHYATKLPIKKTQTIW